MLAKLFNGFAHKIEIEPPPPRPQKKKKKLSHLISFPKEFVN
jgi:hypothetical protein